MLRTCTRQLMWTQVVFTPPHYSDLAPVELIWAYIKQAVSSQYDINTTLEDVRRRLLERKENIPSRVVEGCFRKARSFEDKFYKRFVLNEQKPNIGTEAASDIDKLHTSPHFMSSIHHSESESDSDTEFED